MLIVKLEDEAERDRQVNAWPTLGDDRRALEEVAQAAADVAISLGRLSPRAGAEFATATYQAFGRPLLDTVVTQAMQQLAHACRSRVETMPAQSRRESFPNVVRAVWEVARTLGVQLSPRAGTPFHDLCQASFELLDITGRPRSDAKGTKQARSAVVDPAASIRKFQKRQQGTQSAGAEIS